MSTEENRRAAFRVETEVGIHINTPHGSALQDTLDNFDEFRMRYCLTTHIHYQREMRLPTLKLIEKRQPEVASYIEHLEKQIEKLAGRVSSNADFASRDSLVPVNLSANGVRLETMLKLELGQMIELGIMLPQNQDIVLAIAEVMRVELKPSENGRIVSLAFRVMHNEDREALIRYIMKVQQLELQSRQHGAL